MVSVIALGSYQLAPLGGKKFGGLFDVQKPRPGSHTDCGLKFVASASRRFKKKDRNGRKMPKTTILQKDQLFANMDPIDKSPTNDEDSSSSVELVKDGTSTSKATSSPTRGAVLQACVITSGLLLALGVLFRQGSHIAFTEGWTNMDSASQLSFHFEMWHIELILGLVILVSSGRYLLLKSWPDFSESSEAANQQILSSLELLDYLVVSFLPGISEELLFRGALMPLLGLDWKSALVAGAVFGGLHLGSGRKYSYVVWATFVGFAYGMATITSSSIIVPMVSHSLNNLIGGLLWRLENEQDRKGNL